MPQSDPRNEEFSGDLRSLQHIKDAMNEKEGRECNSRPISNPNRNQPCDRVRAVASALVDLVPGLDHQQDGRALSDAL